MATEWTYSQLDTVNVFDSVWHKDLPKKLNPLGFQENMLMLMRLASYLQGEILKYRENAGQIDKLKDIDNMDNTFPRRSLMNTGEMKVGDGFISFLDQIYH